MGLRVLRRRRPWAIAAVVGAALLTTLLVILLDGDEGGSGAAAPADPWAVIEVDPQAPFLPTLANADLAVGANRLSFTIQDVDGIIRGDLVVAVDLYDLEADARQPVAQASATFIPYGGESPLPAVHVHAEGGSLSDDARYVGRGVYVVPALFAHAGTWGVEFSIRSMEGSEAATVRFRLAVREEPTAPGVGEPAPRSVSRTLADEPAIERLTSDPQPEPGLYQVSIEEALARPRPLIVAFATPAYCHSRTCGPTLAVVKAVWREYAGRVDAIHVEVFENPHEPTALREAAAFLAWGLPSEPWVFVVDGAGRVAARYEGTITETELRADVRRLLGE